MHSKRVIQAFLIAIAAACLLAMPVVAQETLTPNTGPNQGITSINHAAAITVTMPGTYHASESQLIPIAGGPTLTTTDVTINSLATWDVTSNFDLTGAAPGTYTLKTTSVWLEPQNTIIVTSIAGAFTVTDAPPLAVIDDVSPSPGVLGEAVHFEGQGVDSYPAATTFTAYEWRSSTDGVFATTSEANYAGLSAGSHTIDFRARNAAGTWSGWTAWTGNPLQIYDHTVTASIDSVTPNPQWRSGNVNFQGSGACTWPGDVIVAYDWQSDLDGPLGGTATLDLTTLSVGSHTITLRTQCTSGRWSAPVNYAGNPLVINNNLPTQPTVDVTPDAPVTGDDLHVAASGSTDADGEPITQRYEWHKDTVHQPAHDNNTVVPASATARGQVWRCVVTPNDGVDDGPSGQDEVTIGNTPPVQPTVATTPANPTTSDSLTARVSGGADADGDSVTVTYQWHKNAVPQPGRTYATLAAQWTSPGDDWKCVVTPNDGLADGTPGEDTVAVEGNVAPTQPTVAIKPARPTNDDSLRASVTGSTDANGDEISYSYAWYKDGTLQPDRRYATVAARWTRPGQQWRCVVTPSDGMLDGTAGEDTVTINTPPPTPTIEITPAAPSDSDRLACNVTNKDADGDTITYNYQWYADGVLQVGVRWPRVGAWRTRTDQEWACVVTSSDGIETGPSATATVDIGQAVTQPTVVINPTSPSGHTRFVAAASGSVCADGSDPAYAYQWYRNGTLEPGLTWRTVAAWRSRVGDVWRCVVTPSDGVSFGPTGEASVTVQPNTPPTAPTVVIAPANPTTDEGFRATASGSTDADGDPVSYNYQWFKNGVLQPGVTWQRIGASRTREGQTWRCVVTPNDGFADGATGEASVTIGTKGAALTVSSLAATPTAAGAELSFTLSANASVTCEVLNIAGRAVKTIVSDRPLAEGINSLAWDGRNAAGLRAPAGTYLVRMTATTPGGARWTAVGTLNLTR